MTLDVLVEVSITLSGGILVGHARLHGSLETLALLLQFSYRCVLLLQSPLQVLDHALFNFFELLDLHLLDLLVSVEFSCVLVVRL